MAKPPKKPAQPSATTRAKPKPRQGRPDLDSQPGPQTDLTAGLHAGPDPTRLVGLAASALEAAAEAAARGDVAAAEQAAKAVERIGAAAEKIGLGFRELATADEKIAASPEALLQRLQRFIEVEDELALDELSAIGWLDPTGADA